MASMDIFNSDAFSLTSLTDAVRLMPHKPGMLMSENLVTPKPIRTETFFIEMSEGSLALIPTSPNGAPLPQAVRDSRTVRDFRTVRTAKGDIIYASEIANIRAFGSESEFQQVSAEVAARLAKLVADMDYTMEYRLLGMIQGIVLDSDGSTLANWFTEMGVSQPAEIDFDLDNATPASGAVVKKCKQVVDQTRKAAKGARYSRIRAKCGKEFIEAFVTHKEVRETYLGWSAAMELRALPTEGASFFFGGIEWQEYIGSDDDTTIAIGSQQAKFYPVGPDIFQQAISPHPSFEYVNTPGRDLYSLLIQDRDRNLWVQPELYNYSMHYCTRPGMLQRAKMT